MARFSDCRVVITGSASGIGREMALRFAAEGAHVVGGDLNFEGGEETAEMCRSNGRSSSFVRTDVTVEADIGRLLGHVVATLGGVDVLINNAGSSGVLGPIESVDSDDWDRTQAILLRSAFYGIKHAAPLMKAQERGAIINTASIAGWGGYPFGHAYCAAKAGVINLTRSAAIELGPFGVRVNCICPGDVLTPMLGPNFRDVEQTLNKRQPIGRAGRPADIAGAALYLASDDAEWVTGEALTVDGGATVGIWTFGPESLPENAPEPGFKGPSFLGGKPAAKEVDH